MTSDRAFVIDENHKEFNQSIDESEFREYVDGNFFYFKDGKFIKGPCECTCKLEYWKVPDDRSSAINTMNEALEKHIQKQIEMRLEMLREQVEIEVRERFPKIKIKDNK